MTNDLGDEIIKRFTHSEIVNYLMEFHFTIRTYISKNLTQNFQVYDMWK